MAFRLLHDYVLAGHYVPVFKIHILGMYGYGERFCMALLEKLFNDLLEPWETKVEFTYDSINYIISSQYRYKSMPIYHLSNGKLINYNLLNLPQSILKKIYHDKFVDVNIKHPKIHSVKDTARVKIKLNKYNHMLSEIHRCIPVKYERTKDSSGFAALNIYSNIQIDKMFEHVVDEHDVLDVIKNNKSISDLLADIKKSKNYLKVFTPQLLKFMSRDLELIVELYNWWTGLRYKTTLDKIIREQIKTINFSVKRDVASPGSKKPDIQRVPVTFT
jgi:hypothetical protein